MTEFKVGQTVRRFKGQNMGQYTGYEGVIEKIELRNPPDRNGDWLHFADGTRGFSASFEFVADVQPTGPVVTETVTKTRIVPGTYDRVEVTLPIDVTDKLLVCLTTKDGQPCSWKALMGADQLDAAAAVLSALAKGLRSQTCKYQCREIGEGWWRDCSKDEYDRFQLDPHHDTRVLS